MTAPRTPPAASSCRRLLQASGLRCTPAREAVLAHLSRRGRPLAHGEIARARGLAALDRVTLYRTLGALQDAGLVHRVQGAVADLGPGAQFLALRPGKDGHPGDRGNAGDGLAAKTQGAYVEKVFCIFQLAGGMSFNGQGEFLAEMGRREPNSFQKRGKR